MKPVSFIVTLSNEESPDLTEAQEKLLEAVLEKLLSEGTGRDLPKRLVEESYLLDDEDAKVLNELWNEGWDVEVSRE